MNPSSEVLASASRYPGQISWDYDRAEIIADGAVHAIGVCLGLIGARHDRRNRSQDGTDRGYADLDLRDRSNDDARALGRLQHVAGLSRQVGSAALRPLRDLFIDRLEPTRRSWRR